MSDHIPRSYLDVVFKPKDSHLLFIGRFHNWMMAIFWLSETTGLGKKAPFFFANGLTAFLKRALVSTPPGSATLQLPLISASVQKQLAFLNSEKLKITGVLAQIIDYSRVPPLAKLYGITSSSLIFFFFL